MINKLIHGLESHLWRKIGFGFFILAPLLVTFAVLAFIGVYIDGFVRPLPFVENQPYDVPGIGIVMAVVVFYLVGSMASTKIGRRFVRAESLILSHIPLIKTIYKVVRQARDALTTAPTQEVSRVVFIEWPRSGMTALGLVTGRYPSSNESEGLLVVYVPTVPNPTSGNLAFVPESEIIDSGLTVEQAMKVVFSGGTVLPDEIQLKKTSPPPEDIKT